MTPQSVAATLRDSEIFNKTRRLLQSENIYTDGKDKMSRGDRISLQVLWFGVMRRATGRLAGLFTRVNNAGSELLYLGFNPKLLACDEAGQVALASLTILLTSFNNWLALYVLGDAKQLSPYDPSGIFNEFRHNSRMSILGLFEKKGLFMRRLRRQYRMAPAISFFPRLQWYPELEDDITVIQKDNNWRKTFRELVAKNYGVQVEAGGSEYVVFDMVNSQSRPWRDTQSLCNWANVDAICTFADELLVIGVPASDITMLVYYVGEKELISIKLKDLSQAPIAPGQKRTWEFEKVIIQTVDAYQGQENHFVLLEIVVAHQYAPNPKPVGKPPAASANPEDDLTEFGNPAGRLSAHAKNPRRICCGLTRPQAGLAVWCKLPQFSRGSSSSRIRKWQP